ncbi:dTDP-4-dehydrorhamnose reductase [Roseibacterium sp. SDUM158017]|uniref:dTDP-4-dehydrorhamnose reductase n=1 Tax=Roseicyclus salinarum TaxID=3036773 RepID=UPI0024154FC7|nr:dTDP-4-dehydrorhamnose reductase [Roseibacterium sp. SDUM158017]MDG4647152.1 dTDP-4-dehydrorhamnose reductase [Roseibacterium sp. SDUM158017]
MRVLVFGRTGQVATELARAADVIALGRGAADLGKPEDCAAAIREHAPDAVINAAAYTAVDGAEEDETLATIINGAAPAAMARACAELGVPLVHISTDYVFDGEGASPRRPDEPTGPLGAYGRSKLAGEEGVRAAGGPHAILRTSWVVSAHGANFVKTMLRVGPQRGHLRVVSDQIGGPTPAADIAAACLKIAGALSADPAKSGTYHFAGAPDTSWAGFARAIFEAAGLEVGVEEIPSTDYPTPARRPLNSRLDCSATEAAFGIARPDWREGLAAILTDLKAKGDLA